MCMNTCVDTRYLPTYLTYKYTCFSFYKSIPILSTNKVRNTRLENPKPRRRSKYYSQSSRTARKSECAICRFTSIVPTMEWNECT